MTMRPASVRPGRLSQGFTLIEILTAIVLIALVLGTVVISNIRLAEINSRAEVQALEASAAEGIAQIYANDLPSVGTTVSGRVTNVVPLQQLSPSEREVWSLLTYSLTRSSNIIVITITRSDVVPDPNPLTIEVTL